MAKSTLHCSGRRKEASIYGRLSQQKTEPHCVSFHGTTKFTACNLLAIATALLLVAPGCKKAPSQTLTQDRYGIGIDWPRLDTGFTNSDVMVQVAASAIKRSILYHQFPQAISDLEKLSHSPSLTDPQRKILSDLRDQTQQIMVKTSSPQAAQ